jgi:hypothetical protein
MTSIAEPAYVAAVLMLYIDLPDTPLRSGPSDQRLAQQLFERAIPLSLVESAFLLASLRRLLRPAGLPALSPIRSLAYFHPVITELQQQPLPSGYVDYLRLKLRRVSDSMPADVQKPTLSDERPWPPTSAPSRRMKKRDPISSCRAE